MDPRLKRSSKILALCAGSKEAREGQTRQHEPSSSISSLLPKNDKILHPNVKVSLWLSKAKPAIGKARTSKVIEQPAPKILEKDCRTLPTSTAPKAKTSIKRKLDFGSPLKVVLNAAPVITNATDLHKTNLPDPQPPNKKQQDSVVANHNATDLPKENLPGLHPELPKRKQQVTVVANHNTTDLHKENLPEPQPLKKKQQVSIVTNHEDQLFPEFFVEDVDEDAPFAEISPENNSLQIEASEIDLSAQTASSPVIENKSSQPSTVKSKRKVSPRANVRKRGVNPSFWKKNQAKLLLDTGKAHVTPRGKEKKEREMGPPCGDSCYKCKKPKVTEAERAESFTHFWNIGLHVAQWDYLSRLVKCCTPVKSTARPGHGKNTTRQYFLIVNGKRKQVCKTMFLRTFGIADCWIESALKHNDAGKKHMTQDMRGKHMNRPNRTPEETVQSVHEHIKALPRVYSHYCRERTKREYLEPGLSIERLYKKYAEWVKPKKLKKIASAKMYREIFVKNYNIGFFIPRKDQCLTCNKWNTGTKENRENMIAVYSKHLKEKKNVKKLREDDLEECKQNAKLCVAAFDLQKVLTVPRSDTSVFFYCNKLSLYNLTIFEYIALVGRCYMWNETAAKRGPNEVGSALFLFFEALSSKGVKEFRLYSDCCSGQNKNRFIFCVFVIASLRFDIKITHRFLETGHSWSGADGVHARIEGEAKGKHIFSVEEWNNLILGAKQNGETYEIIQMAGKVLNFSPPTECLNWTIDSENERIFWSKVREVMVDCQDPYKLTFKYAFDEDARTLNLKPKKRGHPINLKTYMLSQAHPRKIPLRAKKCKDIEACMKNLSIPEKYHNFYSQIIADVGDDSSDVEERIVDTDEDA